MMMILTTDDDITPLVERHYDDSTSGDNTDNENVLRDRRPIARKESITFKNPVVEMKKLKRKLF